MGNYFGMIKPLVGFQDKGEVFAFLADYHSMTSLFDAKERQDLIMKSATVLLACGINTNKTVFFQQSSVPEVTELAWILSTVTPMGLLERCHSFKDKTSKGIPVNHGLLSYPVLMAADILIYKSELIPVGKDQIQHLEVTRDIATHFNQKYGDYFPLPKPFVQDSVAVVPGLDGQKMAKSHGNSVDLFVDPKVSAKQIMSIVMDSRPIYEPKPDAANNIAVQLLKIIDPALGAGAQANLENGTLGYGQLKKTLAERFEEYFSVLKTEYDYLSNHQDYVRCQLIHGGLAAQKVASQTMEDVKKMVGLTV